MTRFARTYQWTYIIIHYVSSYAIHTSVYFKYSKYPHVSKCKGEPNWCELNFMLLCLYHEQLNVFIVVNIYIFLILFSKKEFGMAIRDYLIAHLNTVQSKGISMNMHLINNNKCVFFKLTWPKESCEVLPSLGVRRPSVVLPLTFSYFNLLLWNN